ncbi:MAG: M23 family metallopeptidase [Thermoleophilaceae bacterium]
MRSFATRPLRTGAIAFAGLSLLAAGQGNAWAARADAAPLTELRVSLVRLGLPVPSGRALAEGAERLADAAERERTRFPVAGEFNWGQDGARFGASRSGRSHEGQDVFARTATPLLAVTDGVVLERGDDGGRGNYVAIFDPSARRTYVYLHMLHPSKVKARERVRAGEWVGGVGCTGSCFGDHLHFEIHRGRTLYGPAEDPLPRLRRWAELAGLSPTLPPGES